jgi:hypothetical protein
MASTERTLEDTLETALEALTYITANSVPVLNWGDVTSDTAYPCVSVRVQARERVAPNADYYRLVVEVVAYRYMQDDKNQVTSGKALDEIFAEISTWAHGLTAAGLSVDGIVGVAGIEDISDGIHSKGVSFEVFETIA